MHISSSDDDIFFPRCIGARRSTARARVRRTNNSQFVRRLSANTIVHVLIDMVKARLITLLDRVTVIGGGGGSWRGRLHRQLQDGGQAAYSLGHLSLHHGAGQTTAASSAILSAR